MNKLRIALLAGGWSSERDVSIKSGNAVFQALNKEKYIVHKYDPKDNLRDLFDNKGNIDLAFILLHGKNGEDGRIQALLDLLKIPYVGSGMLSSAITMNKYITKKLYRKADIVAPKEIILKNMDNVSLIMIRETLGQKVIVKPLTQGSSIGMSFCNNDEKLISGLAKAFQYDKEIMIEEYINGREISCCVIGGHELQALPLIEIIPKNPIGLFDYKAKYIKGASSEICPAKIDYVLTNKIKKIAIKAHQILGLRVWSRTDLIIKNDNIYTLETNTIPGMTSNSLFPLAAKTAGISFPNLLDQLILISCNYYGNHSAISRMLVSDTQQV